jgi:hypothetical protein
MSAVPAIHPIADDPHPAHLPTPVEILAAYGSGATRREIVVQGAARGSSLVIDRCAHRFDDQRLIAHLAADESSDNAALVCADYLRRIRARADCRPRAVAPSDLAAAPFARDTFVNAGGADACVRPGPLVDADGGAHQIEAATTPGLAIPELRWRRRIGGNAVRTLSVREVIGCLESYEPVRTLSAQAVSDHRRQASISVATLRAELERVAASRIVLNRGLRERVVRTVNHQQVSMSEIAIRCGRVKRDARGNVSGETSWLARRLGLLPEGGEARPTPWIHSDVLALIARNGLGLSPREVELA